ncbi:hypothetical protein N7G274_010130 [Stereocaulon virgatum]|uniref:Uncharacterized protein n=1 Tax=Stereocaulon virgatum TaxID=373712 RepID=A0ABR3ZVD5_9LECA
MGIVLPASKAFLQIICYTSSLPCCCCILFCFISTAYILHTTRPSLSFCPAILYFHNCLCSSLSVYLISQSHRPRVCNNPASQATKNMQFIVLAAVLPLAIANAGLSPRSLLLARQGGDAFVPGTGSFVTNCATPCGATQCLDVPRGDTCCTEGYGCPGGSFCLTQGYCCPDGDDPATCASQFGVSLPSGFKPGQTVPAGAASSAAPTLAPSSAPVSTTAVGTSSALPTLLPNNSTPAPTGTGVPLGPSIVPFTGEAKALRFGGAVAVLVGAVGLLVL